jgi:hypothetical protein
MPMTAVITTYARNRIIPAYRPDLAVTKPCNIPPSTTIAAGTVIGQVTSAANDVQTITDTPTITAGTFTLSGTNPITGAAFTTANIAYNASNAAVKAALELVLGAGITVTVAGGGLPGADTTLTFSGAAASRPVPLLTVNNAGLTGGTLAVAHTTTGRTLLTVKAYASGNSDGSQNPIGIMEQTFVSDAAGNVTVSDLSGQSQPNAMYYFGGIFDCSDLIGLDANAVTKLGGVLSAGTVTAGTMRF